MPGTAEPSTKLTGTVPGIVPVRRVDEATDLGGVFGRIRIMRIALVALAAALLVPAPAPAARHANAGVSTEVPQGWSVVTKPLSPCTNPVQRLALRGHGALVQIVETLDYAYVHRFPARPRRFALRGPAQYQACCPPRDAKGWFLSFRDGNRGFYAYVYLGGRGTRAEVLRVLDSLRVRARPASG